MDRLEVLCTTGKAPSVTSQYSICVFRGARDGNPERKSRVGDDALRICLEEYGLDLSPVDDILLELESTDTAQRWLDAIPA
jgi:hypothetical protein